MRPLLSESSRTIYTIGTTSYNVGEFHEKNNLATCVNVVCDYGLIKHERRA